MEPLTRIETYLAKMAGQDLTVPEPITRIEIYLAHLAGADVALPEPVTNDECFLARLCGESAPELEPITRIQMLVAGAIAKEAPAFEPLTREEAFWFDYIDSLGPKIVYKTVSGAVVSFDDGADNLPVRSLEVEINPVQEGSGDPSPENIRPITGWDSIHVYHSGADTSDPETVTVQIPTPPGTVYGGTLDVTNGVLMVDRIRQDGGTLTNKFSSGVQGTVRYAFLASNTPKSSIAGKCNALIFKLLNQRGGVYTCYTAPVGNVYMIIIEIPETYDTIEKAQTFVDENNLEFVYYLEEPIPYHLTPQEVKTLLGTNTLWADSGDVTVEYPAVEQEGENA